jgi:la-related protein 1
LCCAHDLAPAAEQLYGLEKFWAFLRYRKSAKPLEIMPELGEVLKKFKTIDDFR